MTNEQYIQFIQDRVEPMAFVPDKNHEWEVAKNEKDS